MEPATARSSTDFTEPCRISSAHNRSSSSNDHPILLDRDQGPHAGEYLFQALAACVISTLIYHAAARRVVIEEVESKVEGDIDLRGFLGTDKSVRNGFQNIRQVTRLTLSCDLDHRSSDKSDVLVSGNVMLIAVFWKANVFNGIEQLLRLPGVILAVPATFAILRPVIVSYRQYGPYRGEAIEGLSAAMAIMILLFVILGARFKQLGPWPKAVSSPVSAAIAAHGTG